MARHGKIIRNVSQLERMSNKAKQIQRKFYMDNSILRVKRTSSTMKKGSGRGVCEASRHEELSEDDNYMEPFIGKKMGSKAGLVRNDQRR